MKHETTGSRAGGIAASLLGLGWVCLMGKAMVMVWREGPVVSDLVYVGFVASPGILCLVYGIGQLLSLHEIFIERGQVTVKTRGLLGCRRWGEPIAAYKGVLKESQYYAETKRSASRVVYKVKLAHNAWAKEIVLYQASSTVFLTPESWERSWRQYGELFNLPLLEEIAEGVALSQPHDRDIPVQERIRQGTVQFRRVEPVAAKLGRMVRVRQEDDAWVFTFQQGWTIWKSVVLLVLTAFLAALSFSGLLEHQHLVYFVLPTAIAMLLVGLCLRRRLSHPEQIAIDRRALLYRYWQRQGGWRTDVVPISTIRAVSVRPDPSRPQVDDLVIEMDGREIRLGSWLPRKSKIRTKDLLLSLIADAPQSPPAVNVSCSCPPKREPHAPATTGNDLHGGRPRST